MTMTLLGPNRTEPMRRSVPQGSVRAIEVGGRPVIQLQVVQYKVVDSYRTLFWPQCMSKSFEARKPQLCLNHSWDIENVVGRSFQLVRDQPDEGPIVDFYLANFEYVPNARMVYSQVQDEILDECSVGFDWDYASRKPTDEEKLLYPGVEEIITEIDWTETSIVLRGAVTGAKVTGWRSHRTRSDAPITRSTKWIEEETSAQIVLKLTNPDAKFSVTDALIALREAAVEMPERPEPDEDEADEKDDSADGAKPEETAEDGTEPDEQQPAEEPVEASAGQDGDQDQSAAKLGDESQPESQDTEVVTEAEIDEALELVGGRF